MHSRCTNVTDIGTSSSQWADGKNWGKDPDECQGNTVRENYIQTRVRGVGTSTVTTVRPQEGYGVDRKYLSSGHLSLKFDLKHGPVTTIADGSTCL